MGHEKVLTTFLSYGEVACQRQGEIIRELAMSNENKPTDVDEIAEAIFKKNLERKRIDGVTNYLSLRIFIISSTCFKHGWVIGVTGASRGNYQI